MDFETIIIGGSYAGLSAALSLGRALRSVLVIDSGKSANLQSPISHNFLTQDGESPSRIREIAKEQVLKYENVKFYTGFAVSGIRRGKGFEIKTQGGDTFTAKKLIFATGLIDIIPEIKGFAECWGISILHCPYCHGYEAKDLRTGILANDKEAYESAKMIYNWSKNLTVFTDGKSTIDSDQVAKLAEYNIEIIEKEIESIDHENGQIKSLVFKDQTKTPLQALYCHTSSVQSCDIPETLGCELTDKGCINVDLFQKTNVEGVYACGDNASLGRSVAVAVQAGSVAGIFANKEIIEESF